MSVLIIVSVGKLTLLVFLQINGESIIQPISYPMCVSNLSLAILFLDPLVKLKAKPESPSDLQSLRVLLKMD